MLPNSVVVVVDWWWFWLESELGFQCLGSAVQSETFAAAAAGIFPVFAVSAVLSGALHLYGHCVCFIVVFRHGATVTKLYFLFLALSAQHTHTIYTENNTINGRE